MLQYPETFDLLASRVKPELFTSPLCSLVYSSAAAMRIAGETISFVTLTRHMGMGDIANCGGPGAIGPLLSDPALPSLGEKWVVALEEAFSRRNVLVLSEKLNLFATSGGTMLEIAEIGAQITSVVAAPEKMPDRIKPIGRLLGKMIDEMEAAKNGTEIEYPSTGFPLLDYYIEGLCPATYIIIAAETSGGKTALALQFARQFSIKDRKPSLVVTYEMPEDRLTKRIMASDSRVGMKAIKTGKFESGQLAQMEASMARVIDAPLHIMDSVSQFKIAELRAFCRNAHRQLGLGLIIVDYLQLVPPTNPKDSRERQVAEISFQLQKMSQELGVCVVSMSQVNDDGLLRESRAIGHDADVVMVIEGNKEQEDRVLHIIKNRDGEMGRIELKFDGANQTFYQAK